ncbi:hypothetical protein BDAP_002658 [Binucleata daphniae]
MIQNKRLGKYEYSVRSNVAEHGKYPYSTLLEMLHEDTHKKPYNHVDKQYDNVKEKEIYNNHIQQTSEIGQETRQKIETCKKLKKNAENFIELKEGTKKLTLKKVNFCQSKNEKLDKSKNSLEKKNKYKYNNFMKKSAIGTYNLAEYMPVCITKYAYNKEIFDKQTEDIRTTFHTGVIDFDRFFDTLNKEIYYEDNDKKTLAELVDTQMNDFLHTNINSLTLLFPKMQFFMDYYNKYQDNLVFFEDMKHVCMVYGMMHKLETILKCTEHTVDKMKTINKYMIDCGDGKEIYDYNIVKPQITYFLVAKCEIEKMLLYILQSFLPTDHFINLVNLFHIESVCSLGILRFIVYGSCFQNPSQTDSALLQMSIFCYIHFDTLQTDNNGTRKNIKHIFFRYLFKHEDLLEILIKKQQNYSLQDLPILNNCFSIYIRKNADKLCDSRKKTYNELVVIHNFMQDQSLGSIINNNKYYLETIIANSDSKIIDEYRKYKHHLKAKQITYHRNKLSISETNFYKLVCYILKYMCDYIIACEATFLMSYDITSDKNTIEERITYYMKIIENWNDIKNIPNELVDNDMSFKKPTMDKNHD